MIIATTDYFSKKLAGLPKQTQDRVMSSFIPLEMFGADEAVMVKAYNSDGYITGLDFDEEDFDLNRQMFSEIRTALRPTTSEKGSVIWDEEDM